MLMLWLWSFQIPPDIVSNGEYLTIHFRTDDSIHWKGFYATYVLTEAPAQFQNKLFEIEDLFKA